MIKDEFAQCCSVWEDRAARFFIGKLKINPFLFGQFKNFPYLCIVRQTTTLQTIKAIGD